MNILIAYALAALWTAAWLHWFFRGELRQFLFCYVFPESWSAGRPVEDILSMLTDEFDMFMAAESQAPRFVRGVLGCPGCLSAYISAVGTLFAVLAFGAPWLAAPLLWAAAAWTGHRLHHHL